MVKFCLVGVILGRVDPSSLIGLLDDGNVISEKEGSTGLADTRLLQISSHFDLGCSSLEGERTTRDSRRDTCEKRIPSL